MKFGGKNLASPVKGGADANLGATGGDGGGEVAAHAHGEFAQRDLKMGGEVVAEGAELVERALGVIGGFGGRGAERGDGHQPVEAQIFFCEGELEEPRRVFDFGAEFGGVTAGVDLEENGEDFPELGGGAIEVVEEFFGIDALDAVKVRGGEFGFVGLEVADEFPLKRGRGAEGAFLGGFLDAVFADGAEAVAGGVVGGGDGVGLGDGEEFDRGGIAAGGGAGGGDLSADDVGAADKFLVGDKHGMR